VLHFFETEPYLSASALNHIYVYRTGGQTLAASWGCTPEELHDLSEASLTATAEMLAYAQSLGKVLSISCHSSSASNQAYYNSHVAILAAFPSTAIRFYGAIDEF